MTCASRNRSASGLDGSAVYTTTRRSDPATVSTSQSSVIGPTSGCTIVLRPAEPTVLTTRSAHSRANRVLTRLFDLPGTGFADNLARKLDVLRSHCDDAGRDYDTIEKTVSGFVDPAADPASTVAHLAELASLGIGHAIVSPRGPWDEGTLDRMAQLVRTYTPSP